MDPGSSRQGRVALLACLLLLPVALAGCTTGPLENQTVPTTPPGTNGTEDDHPTEPPATPELNAGRVLEVPLPTPAVKANATTLMDLVRDQVYLDGNRTPRYRTPGTVGHAGTIPILQEMLASRGANVSTQVFETELPRLGPVNLTHVYGQRDGASSQEIWLAAHWDSRAWADAEPGQAACTGDPVLGANDGAAGVAVVAHALELLPATNFTIRIALFDGEDQGCQGEGWAKGSKLAAHALNETEVDRIFAFLLVDMPGDKDLMLRKEGRSHSQAPELTEAVWGTAADLGALAFVDERGPSIEDDHVGFLARGVPAVDLIHLDKDPARGPFPATHHTLNDTPEHLSGENMAQVTEVVVSTILRLDAAYGGQVS